MNNIKYQKDTGSTVVCTKIMTKATKGIGQEYIKGAMKYCFLFDSLFSSKKAEGSAVEVGAGLIGMLKTNNKGCGNETIEKVTKDWPGGSYLVLRSKPMVPRSRPLIGIVYKYNVGRLLHFIATSDAGIKKSDTPYLSKYTDQFTDVSV